MYDFLYSEVWWMETLYSAMITGGCVLIGALVAGAVTLIVGVWMYKHKMQQEHHVLEGQHSSLGTSHNDRFAAQAVE